VEARPGWALYGARAGLDVVVIEKRSGTIDKACGEGLMPHSLAHLDRLGVDPPGKPLRGISYHDGHRSAHAAFRSGVGRGVQRTALHGALLDAVAAAGVKVVHGGVGEVARAHYGRRCAAALPVGYCWSTQRYGRGSCRRQRGYPPSSRLS
jgi:2-polyprenyl-6-methoxyphenol hydroxylase-like FAD-dependent oxidoreductase